MQEFLAFIAGIFEVDVSDLSEDTAYEVYEKWDSMMQLRLVMEVEEKYDVNIPLEEVVNIRSLKDLYQYTLKG